MKRRVNQKNFALSLINTPRKSDRTSSHPDSDKDTSEISYWDILQHCNEDLTASASSSPRPTETDSYSGATPSSNTDLQLFEQTKHKPNKGKTHSTDEE